MTKCLVLHFSGAYYFKGVEQQEALIAINIYISQDRWDSFGFEVRFANLLTVTSSKANFKKTDFELLSLFQWICKENNYWPVGHQFVRCSIFNHFFSSVSNNHLNFITIRSDEQRREYYLPFLESLILLNACWREMYVLLTSSALLLSKPETNEFVTIVWLYL